MLRKILNSYFGFNRQQQNGLLVLCVVSMLIFIVRLNIHSFITPNEIIINHIDDYENMIDSMHRQKTKKYISSGGQLFAFNPNSVTKAELLKLGFKEKTAETFIKFRNKGFQFRKKDDLKKIYGVSENFYGRLEPYIIINTSNATFTEKQGKSITIVQILELNAADSLNLISLKGIGPGYAKRILKYRSMLGGFTHIEQIKEVYGMSEELYELVKQQCKIDKNMIRKINLNTADFKSINKHPYISYELTKHLVNTRNKIRLNKENINGIIEDTDIIEKLLPYLEF